MDRAELERLVDAGASEREIAAHFRGESYDSASPAQAPRLGDRPRAQTANARGGWGTHLSAPRPDGIRPSLRRRTTLPQVPLRGRVSPAPPREADTGRGGRWGMCSLRI